MLKYENKNQPNINSYHLNQVFYPVQYFQNYHGYQINSRKINVENISSNPLTTEANSCGIENHLSNVNYNKPYYNSFDLLKQEKSQNQGHNRTKYPVFEKSERPSSFYFTPFQVRKIIFIQSRHNKPKNEKQKKF